MLPQYLLAVAGLLLCPLSIAATPQDRAAGEQLNYVFASELGSGIYDMDGRSLQVYRIPLERSLREPTEHRPGFRLVYPVTIGFLDFTPFDIPGDGLPSRFDSFSLTPGIEMDFLLPDDWVLRPWVRTGPSFVGGGVNGWLYSLGLGAERESDYRGWELRRRHELVFSGVAYRGKVPDDRYVRIRQAAELRKGTKLDIRGQQVEVGLYGLFDVLIDPPAVTVAGTDGEPLRLEVGIMTGLRPGLLIWRFGLPRIGFGYRLAGELSGWHIALGTQF